MVINPSIVLNNPPFFSTQIQGKKQRYFLSERTTLAARRTKVRDANYKAFASRKHRQKMRNDRKESKSDISESKQFQANETAPLEYEEPPIDGNNSSSKLLGNRNQNPRRSAVLQACVVTSGLSLGTCLIIRQVSHVVAAGGWEIIDPSHALSFDFETWHVGVILGLVILISSSRYILLKIWPDFSESSEAAYKQTLSSLHPLDYIVVAALAGISEELLFRGALLPLFGLDWKGAFVAGAIFGVLHLGSGRRYSYVIWAALVGFVYGLATISTSSILVPMTLHSINNLIGGFIWKFEYGAKYNEK